jgi:hypothetical protein
MIYVQNFLKLAQDDSPEVRMALARSLADTDFLIQSLITAEMYSSKKTLLAMLKSEKDPAVLEMVRASLLPRIQRDVQKRWLSERDASKLIEKYGLAK